MTPQKRCRRARYRMHLRAVIIVAHSTQLAHPGCWLSHAACRPEQQSWTRRTYVSVLPFLPFGLMQGRFHLHPVMYKVKVRRENKVVVGITFDAKHVINTSVDD